MWEYNEHPDFIPYFDSVRGKWAVSVQYLKVWYFATKEQAKESIPAIREYRREKLKQIDRLNKEFFARQAQLAKELEKALKDYRNDRYLDKPKPRLLKDMSLPEKKRLDSMIEQGYSYEKIMETFNINRRSLAQRILNNERKENDKRTSEIH